MAASVFQYLVSLTADPTPTRTLGHIGLCRDSEGNPVCSAGNSAVVFKAEAGGRICKLRCYTRSKCALREIYGPRLYPAELYIFTDKGGEWADIVVEEWYEGVSLQCAAARSLGIEGDMRRLAQSFELLAAQLLAGEWAHGDLKPDNIIVSPDGTLHLIDFDALYRPGFTPDDCDEWGTRAFQHPLREQGIFDKSIDDYPVALIAVALHALALEPQLYSHAQQGDTLMIDPALAVAGRDPVLAHIEELFARRGDALHYRMARMLHSPLPHLSGLGRLVEFAARGARQPQGKLSLAYEEGLWGYADSEGFVIPPLYGQAFEFSDSLAAVEAGGRWHYIDTQGRVRIDCSACDAITPFRNGRACKIISGRRIPIDPAGREIEAEDES